MSEFFSGIPLNHIEPHKIPEKPVVKNKILENSEVQETTVSIDHNNNRYFIQTITCDIPQNNKEDDKDKLSQALILVTSGISKAASKIDDANRILKAYQETNDLPFNINKIIIVPQLATSVRVCNEKSSDPAQQPTFHDSAEILLKALNNPEVWNTNYEKKDYIPNNSILIGYSTGAAQAIEMAAQSNKFKNLILVDPVGMADFSRRSFFVNFGPKDLYSSIKKYHKQGYNWRESYQLFREETKGLLPKKGNYREYKNQKKEITETYGISGEEMPTRMSSAQIITDSTKKARSLLNSKINVIIGMEQSSPLNFQVLFRQQNEYKNFKEFKNHIINDINNTDNIFRKILKPLFPTIKDESFAVATYPGHSHAVPAIDTGFWKNVFEKFKTLPLPTSTPESNQP